MTAIEESKSARRERLLAAKKVREEIRNAVRHEIVKAELASLDVRKIAVEMINEEVKKRTKGEVFSLAIKQMVRDELRRQYSASDHKRLQQEIQAAVKECVQREAEAFVALNIRFSIAEGGEW